MSIYEPRDVILFAAITLNSAPEDVQLFFVHFIHFVRKEEFGKQIIKEITL